MTAGDSSVMSLDFTTYFKDTFSKTDGGNGITECQSLRSYEVSISDEAETDQIFGSVTIDE